MKKSSFIKTDLLPRPRGGGLPMMQVKLFGQWGKALEVLGSLGRKVRRSSTQAQMTVGNRVATAAKQHIIRQDLGWKKLSPSYQGRKISMGLSSKTMISYKTYYENIGVFKKPNSKLVEVGVKRGVYTRSLNGKKSKIDVATIAALHETSSGKRFPRRPLWAPTIQKLGGIRGMKSMYVTALIWHLRRAGVPVTKGKGNNLKISGNKINPFR